MERRLGGPPYAFDGVNRERGGTITRESLVKPPEPDFMNCCTPYRGAGEPRGCDSYPGDEIADRDGAAYRKRL
jgi:hypothetical protein